MSSGCVKGNAYWWVASKAVFVKLPMVEVAPPPPRTHLWDFFFPKWGVLQCPHGSGQDRRCACSKAEGGGIGVQVLFTPGPGWYLALKPSASWELVSINQPLSLLLGSQLWRLGDSPAVHVLVCLCGSCLSLVS